MKKFFEEFKKFAMRGNVVDMAVGVVVGGAFSKIVTSLVNDIVMPLLGLLLGAVNLKELNWLLRPGSGDIKDLILQYGSFLQSIVDFLIIALSVYAFIKLFERFRRKQETQPAPEPEPTRTEVLLEEIRDELRRLNEQ